MAPGWPIAHYAGQSPSECSLLGNTHRAERIAMGEGGQASLTTESCTGASKCISNCVEACLHVIGRETSLHHHSTTAFTD